MTVHLDILPDPDPINPRKENDNLAIMACAHRRYVLGDEQGATGDGMRQREREGCEVLPLYLYDHSGITIATSPFYCPWDSGQIGYVYVTPERGRETWGRQWRKKARACMEAEVAEYDAYLRGDVWGYRVVDDDTDEEIDSCWGFYGADDAETEGAAALQRFRATMPAGR